MNRLPATKRSLILHCLLEAGGIRSTARIAKVSPMTVMRLIRLGGEAVRRYQDRTLRRLYCRTIEMDEAWSFVHTKRYRKHENSAAEHGDSWVWAAVCRDSRLLISLMAQARTLSCCRGFVQDVRDRVVGYPLICTDGAKNYREAIRIHFDGEYGCRFGQIVKPRWKELEALKDLDDPNGWMPSQVIGKPDRLHIHGSIRPEEIRTTHVERVFLHLRTRCRRFTRRTTGNSKKLAYHQNALALWQFDYNFMRVLQDQGKTPAQLSGLTDKPLTMDDLLGMIEGYEARN